MQRNDFSFTETFPAVTHADRSYGSLGPFLERIHDQRKAIQQTLLRHGALLFRGYPVKTATDFARVIKTLQLGKFVNYIGGDSPRDKVKEEVYTSTEAPPSFYIPLHQELSFIKNFPRHIYFFCEIAPRVGGATIIADARQVLKSFRPEFVDYFQKKGLTYISRYYYQSKMMALANRFQRSHKSWTEVFETPHKDEVEKKCRDSGFKWRWLPKDWLQIEQTRPALVKHELTQETVWFNQAHLYDFNPKLLGMLRYIGSEIFYARKNTKLHEITFSDGSPVPRTDIYYILNTLEQNTVSFPWHASDFLIIDNVLGMHGRAPFKGPRRILTAMTS